MPTNKEFKEIEDIIRRAMWTDRKLPKIGPCYPTSPLGKISPSKDTYRSIEDIIEDLPFRERPTKEDIENWETVMFVWLPKLKPDVRDIVVKRCSGMGWKRIAYQLNCHKSTAWRMFNKGLQIILQHVAPF